MNIYLIPPFLSTVTYAFLTVVVLRSTLTRTRKLFAAYLSISLLYGLGTFLILADPVPDMTKVWLTLMFCSAIAATVAYYQFVCTFVGTRRCVEVGLGYAFVAFVCLPMNLLDYIPQSYMLTERGGLEIDWGVFLHFASLVGVTFIVLSAYRLIRRFNALIDPVERSRVMYLAIGLGVFLAVGLRETVPPLPDYPVAQIGHFLNALIISYAIMKHRLLDLKLVIRRGLANSVVTILITTMIIMTMGILKFPVVDWTNPSAVATVLGLALAASFAFVPLKAGSERLVDRLFYGQASDHRQTILGFAQQMGNVIELSELAEALLKPIVGAIDAAQASLLLPTGDEFVSRFTERRITSEPCITVRLRAGSPIVDWLKTHDWPLLREQIDITPQFKGVWEADRLGIDAAATELLCPMKSKGNLVGILAVSKRRSRGLISTEDIAMLAAVADQAAVVIENAQLYALARERANLDDLTGLYNHRSFHQRMEEEIASCSRYGNVFSTLIVDVDAFKSHNDRCGHLAGDTILREVGGMIGSSVANSDVCFRYGGDEFAVILPTTASGAARKVAERIRRSVEANVEAMGTTVTVSIGIASWPTDGVLREEIISAADAAMYHAKQSGRNRACLASEVVLSEVAGMEVRAENQKAILDTIYALAATVDAKDPFTYDHSLKVSTYASAIAEALGFSNERVALVRTVGLLHDIGKIGIPDLILQKPGRLTSEEWQSIRNHPEAGVSILRHVDDLSGCLAPIRHHHEHYDGTGYPSGLRGQSIPIEARIIAVADAYDAMTCSRPYRHRMTHEQTCAELRRCAGTQFDPDVVDVFLQLYGESASTLPASPTTAS